MMQELPLPSILTPSSFSIKQRGTVRLRSIIFTTHPTRQLGPVFFFFFHNVFAENFVKVIEPIGMRQLHSSRSSQGRRGMHSRSARAAQFTRTRPRSALTATPVNQIINVIQNTATGLLQRKPKWTFGSLRPSISLLNSSLSAPTAIHRAEKEIFTYITIIFI